MVGGERILLKKSVRLLTLFFQASTTAFVMRSVCVCVCVCEQVGTCMCTCVFQATSIPELHCKF